MPKKWIAVNLALLVVTGLLGWQLRLSVARFHAENDLARLQPVKDIKRKIHSEGGLLPLKPPRRYNAADFGIIPAQNLFSETRTNEKAEATPTVDQIPELRVKPILVGVTLAGNQRFASIIEPSGAGNPVSEKRRTQTKRLGDVYQGYTIVDITENQMVLENGPRREVIPLFDATKQRAQPGKTPIVATRVINFGGARPGVGPPGVPTVSTVATVSPSRTPSTPAASPAPTSTAIGGAPQSTPPPNTPGGILRASPQGQPGAQPPGNTPPRPPTTWNERIDEQGRRIIRTPFGDIVRDRPDNQ